MEQDITKIREAIEHGIATEADIRRLVESCGSELEAMKRDNPVAYYKLLRMLNVGIADLSASLSGFDAMRHQTPPTLY